VHRSSESYRDLRQRLARWQSSFLLPFAYALPLLSSVGILWLIWTHTHHVPYLDWETVKLVRHYRDGELVWRDFWYFHNEHRLVIPRMIHLVLIEATNWNRQVEMTFNLGLVLATLLLFWHSARRQGGRKSAAALLALFSLIVLSFAQYENLLFTFQTNYLLAVFGGACCLWGLLAPTAPTWRSRLHFCLALLGAVIASLSTFAGLTTWVAFLPVVWYRGRLRGAVWCAAAVAIIVPYTNGISAVSQGTLGMALHAMAADPTLPVRYMLTILGAPLGYPNAIRAQVAALVGLGLLTVNVLVARRTPLPWSWARAWGGLALYGLASCGVTMLGRAQGGLGFAMTSRYQSFASLWWVACLGLVGIVHRQLLRQAGTGTAARILTPLNRVAYVVVGLGLLTANVAGWRDGLHWPPPTLASESCIVEYQSAPDSCLDPYFPAGPWFVRTQADYLRQQHLGIFGTAAGQVSAPPPLPPGNPTIAYDPAMLRPEPATTALVVDGIGDLSDPAAPPAPIDLPVGVSLTLTGWAVDVLHFSPAHGAFVTVDGVQIFHATYGAAREDAARLLGQQYNFSGFAIEIPPTALPHGMHEITLSIVSAEGLGVYNPYHIIRVMVH